MEKLPTIIQNQADLETLVHMARQTESVAMDTEFVWERTYYPRLGLIQIALSDEDCFLIDPLAIPDLQTLGTLLSDRGVIKILHDAPQDLAILKQATGTAPQNIFDTRLAAGFSDLPATLSLGKLVKELLDIDLVKDETRTNWLQRPLSDKQVEYALNDVRYLRAVRVLLLTRIIGPKIKSWLQEELNQLNNPASYEGPADYDRYLRIRGSHRLSRENLAILRNLTTWREGMARKLDKPRNHVINDTILLDIAKQIPLSLNTLQEGISLSKKALMSYGQTIISIVETSLRQPKTSHPPVLQSLRLTKNDKIALEKLQGLVMLKCEVLGVAPSLVGNAAELKQLVKTLLGKTKDNLPQLRQTEGWRKKFLEDFIRQTR